MFYYLAQCLLAILGDDGVESALIKFADGTEVGVDGSTSATRPELKIITVCVGNSLKLSRWDLVAMYTKHYRKKWKIKGTNTK